MTLLTGTILSPGGLPITGSLFLQLSQDANLISGGGAVAAIPPRIFNLTAGAISGPGAGPYSVPGATELTPAGLTYHLTATGPGGEIVLERDIIITGASVDLGTIVSVTAPSAPLPFSVLGGDATGPAASTTVGSIRNRPLSTLAPTSGQSLNWNGSAWAPLTPAAGPLGTIASDGSVPLTAAWNAGNFTIQSRNSSDVYSVEAYGAVGDGVTDDTTAIQSAINAAYAAMGGVVQFKSKVYRITSTLNLASYTVFQGTYGESNLFGVINTKTGTEIKWDGGNNGTILRAFDTRLFKLDGVYLEGNGFTGLTGILLDSNNAPSGSQNEFSRFSIRRCLIGVTWGTSGIALGSFANDGTRFTTFTIWSQEVGSKGFVINSGNAGQVSTIESGGIQVDSLAIDIVIANQVQIRRVFGGSKLTTAFIRSSVGIDLRIDGCTSEGQGSRVDGKISNDSYFLRVVAPVESYPVGDTTITMSQNYISNPVLVEYPVRIASVGDTWGYCYNAVGAAIGATGTFTAAAAISKLGAFNNGVNAATTHGWIQSANVKMFNFDPGLPLTADSIVAATGLSVTGTGGLTNAANQLGIDQAGPISRFYSNGPDGATRGSYEFHILTSAGTSDTIAIAVSNTGVATLPGLIVAAAPTFSALTPGQVAFPGAAGLLSGDANLFWNNSTKRFSVGTSAGNYTHTVHPTAGTNFGVRAGSDFGAFTGIALESRDDTDTTALPLRFRASQFWFDVGNSGFGTTTPNVTGDFNGAIAMRTGTVAVANGLNSNIVTPAFSYVRLTGPTAVFSIGGFTLPSDGRLLMLLNTAAFAMTIVNEDASSTATNRISTLTGANVTLRAGTSACTLIYDITATRWILMSTN